MKATHLLLPICLGLSSLTAGATLSEPDSSVMSTGHWVKIRVNGDGMYQMTYSELRDLGFEHPEDVHVFGYNPTLLLTHNDQLIPADVSAIPTLHSEADDKLVFYGKGDTDYAPELWQFTSDYLTILHNKHASSTGATYFLSDAPVDAPQISTSDAPTSTPASNVLTSHTALCYYENDITNISEGGSWFAGKPMNNLRPSETYNFEVYNVADARATMVYLGLLSSTRSSKYKNYLLAEYSPEIQSEEATGVNTGSLDNHQLYKHAISFQNLTLPVTDEKKQYEVTFSLHPEASEQESNYMFDFFGLRYARKNNVSGSSQLHMYYENWGAARTFALTGLNDGGNWHVWNVTEPLRPVSVGLRESDGSWYGNIKAATTNYPNEIIAFDTKARQLSPEIVEQVENQNLHALEVPDLVIVTSKMFLSSAEQIAAMHRRLQGLDVAVVDQQDVFNEYSSGNTSAEGVRRFMSHLYTKDPAKIKGLLLLGPGTYNQATLINDDNPYVVTAEAEAYVICTYVTKPYSSDTFFGKFGPLQSSGNWGSRGGQLRILANETKIAVGRVPFSSKSEIDNYYAKVEEYMTEPTIHPAIGNILLASDYYSQSEDPHLNNAEALVKNIGEKAGTTITINRAASNLLSDADNSTTKAIAKSTLERGASFFAYFGHGGATQIGGSNRTTDYLYDMTTAPKINTPGKYPFVYFGSCNIGPYDRTTNNLSNTFLKNRFGGAVAVVASGREVFQASNEYLGKELLARMVNAESGTWFGRIWCEAQSACITNPSSTRDEVCNHLSYNLLGDPAIPYRGETNSLTLNAPEENNIVMRGKNVISGTVNTPDGDVDATFNGHVLLSFYDVPETRNNVLKDTPTSYVYISSIDCDQEVIGEFIGTVKNGQFEVELVGPTSSKNGTHRVQAYAYSDDDRRALGYLGGLTFTDTDEEPSVPEAAPTRILDFEIKTDNAGIMKGESVIYAEVEIPAGLATSTTLVRPIGLTIDGIAYTGLHRLVKFSTPNKFTLSYAVKELSYGHHTATLSVLDAAGEWTEATTEFIYDNTPDATLSAAVDGATVDFELLSSVDTSASKTLIVERLDGNVALTKNMDDIRESINLPAGAYRAYVQVRSNSVATSTPKIEILID